MNKCKGMAISLFHIVDSRIPLWMQMVILPNFLTKIVFKYRLLNSYIMTAAAWLLLFAVLRLFYAMVLYPRYFSPFRHLPTPKRRSWLWGNMVPYFAEPPGMTVRRIAESLPNDGLLRYYSFLNQERLLLTTPKAFAQMLVHDSYNYQRLPHIKYALSLITGHGVGYAEDEEHKYQRKHLAPAFQYRTLKNLYPDFWNKGIEMVQCMERHMLENEGHVNLRDWTCRSTLDIIGVTGMDHDFCSLQDPNNELFKAFNVVFAPPPKQLRYFSALGSFIPPWLLQMIPLPRNKRVSENGDVIRKVAKQMLCQKKAKGLTESDRDIISVAMVGGHFTEENLADQMMTFLAAGHETTAVSLQWFVWAMCKYPDIQARLREEIRANLPSISLVNPDIPDAAMIDALPYLNAVVSEVLRHFPPAPITSRMAQKNTYILDTFVPAGTVAVVSAETTNHDPKLWGPNAAEFNPDRWMAPGCAKSGGATSNYAMMSFIHGPRGCIGQGFVKSEMPCIAAVLAGRFKMELQDAEQELAYDFGVTVFPKNGLDAKFEVVPGW